MRSLSPLHEQKRSGSRLVAIANLHDFEIAWEVNKPGKIGFYAQKTGLKLFKCPIIAYIIMHHWSLTNMIMYQLLKFICSFISSVSRVAFLQCQWQGGKGVSALDPQELSTPLASTANRFSSLPRKKAKPRAETIDLFLPAYCTHTKMQSWSRKGPDSNVLSWSCYWPEEKKAVSSIANSYTRKRTKKLKRKKEYKVFFGLWDEKYPDVVG